MKFTASARLIKFNRAQFAKATDELIMGSIRAAAREFYRAAWPILGGAVDTGMSQASLIPLGRFLRNLPTTVVKRSDPKQGYPKHEYPFGLKSVSTGIASGEQSAGAFNFDHTTNEYVFTFKVNVFHYKINEVTGTYARGSPWGTLIAGQEAYMKRLRSENLNKKLTQIFKDAIDTFSVVSYPRTGA